MQYTVIVHYSEEGGYWVEVPSLPGCFSQGETIDEAMNNVKEAIELHIQGLKDDGQEVPTEKDMVIGRVEAQPLRASNEHLRYTLVAQVSTVWRRVHWLRVDQS